MGKNGKEIIHRYSAFWQGGAVAFRVLGQVLEDTENALSGAPADRLGALCSRASAHYSVVKHLPPVPAFVHLHAAKDYSVKAIEEARRVSFIILTPEQCDVLSTIVQHGIRVLGVGVPFVAPKLRQGLDLALKGLRKCEYSQVREHTIALLNLDVAEAQCGLGQWRRAMPHIKNAISTLSKIADDNPQKARVLKRIGALEVRLSKHLLNGNRKPFDEAREIAKRVAPGQLEKIEILERSVRHRWWHPRRWLIQIV